MEKKQTDQCEIKLDTANKTWINLRFFLFHVWTMFTQQAILNYH